MSTKKKVTKRKVPKAAKSVAEMADDLEKFVSAGDKVIRTVDELVTLVKSKFFAPGAHTHTPDIVEQTFAENRLLRKVLSELTKGGPLYTADKMGPPIRIDVEEGIITVQRAHP